MSHSSFGKALESAVLSWAHRERGRLAREYDRLEFRLEALGAELLEMAPDHPDYRAKFREFIDLEARSARLRDRYAALPRP